MEKENSLKSNSFFRRMDAQELHLPETSFVRDIDGRVFQGMIVKCLEKIRGISLPEGNLIDSFLGRGEGERIKGIFVEQDQKKYSISIRVEILIAYGISIPEKAEEVQTKISEEISCLTGLHVSCVHVIFKGLIADPLPAGKEKFASLSSVSSKDEEEDYSHRF